MNRGTIACRRDPDDKAEWQFSLKKSVDWVKEEEKHQVQGEAANKVEAVEWMKLRAEGLLEDVPGNSEANAALQQVLGKEKVPKALQDREPEAEASAPASSKKKDEDVVEADVLSDIGDRKDTKEATSRVSKMLKLVKSVQKQVGSEKAKALNSSLEALKKLEKVKKPSLEKAKTTLFDAALEIKKVKAL